MSSAYITVGAAQGLEQARRRSREESQEDEDRNLRKSELEYVRGRRKVVDERQDESYNYEVGQRPLEERARNVQVEGAEVSLANARRQGEWMEQDRPAQTELRDLGVDAAKHEFGEAKTQSARQGELYRVQMEKIKRNLEDEGLTRFLDALEDRAQPAYAEKLFNSIGKNGIRPGTTRYDAKTGQLSFTGRDGQQFNGNIKQLRAVLPRATTGNKPMVVGAGGSIYDPATGTWKTPPGGAKGGAATRNGQKLSPFNPQSHMKRAEDLLMQRWGGEWDPASAKFRMPPGTGDKVGAGLSMVNQTIRTLEEEGITVGPGEVADIVGTAGRKLLTSGEAIKRARAELENAGDDVISERAEELIEESKIESALTLKAEIDMLRTRHAQQQASQQWPDAPETSPDMEGGEEGMDAPPVELLREGYVQSFQDGSKWTLENGRAVQVE